MSVYKIPVSVIQSIHSAMARFRWGQRALERKIHWKSWEALCNLKCIGGLGFRDLGVFNEALLGRQAWRLVQAPGSLMGRVLKAKYYPQSSFVDAFLGSANSFSWKSIWGSKSLLKEGLLWRVADGKSIKIWEDPWVCIEGNRFLNGPPVEGLEKVCELIDSERACWRSDRIMAAFSEVDARAILSIPLSERLPCDSLTWAFSKNGIYSVKTAYMVGKSCNFDEFQQAWVRIWSLNVSPKVRHFLWRVCSGTLPVRALLKYRHLLEDDICPLCKKSSKTVCHMLFECELAKEALELGGFLEMIPREGVSSVRQLMEGWCDVNAEKVEGWAVLAWSL